MNCLDNLIGIHRSCSEVTPSSGLWLQNLRGIELALANAAIDKETISGVKLLEEIVTHAQDTILNQMRMSLANKINISSIIQNDTVGFYKQNMKVVPLETDKLKGIKVSIRNYPNLEFFISNIYLNLSSSIDTEIYVYDLMTNKLLDTLDITTVAGVPTAILHNKGYFTKKQRLELFICVNAGQANAYQTNLTPSACYSCGENGYSNKYISFSTGSIPEGSQKINSNISSSSGTNGLSLEYSLNCAIEPFICNMGNQLAWPLLHKVGSELMKELKNSRRLNSIVVIDKEKNESMYEDFENEYMASMTALLDNIKMPNDICFNCNARIKKAVAIP